ncbi:MAG: YicC/YloC family endoribonuclease [Oscillospiraceae bacterium]
MIRSMTGFGRNKESIEGQEITFEIKSVNHRFFEFSSRVPRVYGYLENKLKKYVSDNISRGKVDVNVTIYTVDGIDAQVELNKSLAKGYIDALRLFGDEFNINDDLTLSTVAKFNDIFSVKKVEEEEEIIWQKVKNVADKAISAFIEMREIEGKKMKEDIISRLKFIEDFAQKTEEISKTTVFAYRTKLENKIKEVLEDKNIDEQRIITEAAIFAEKIATDEETVRLQSHVKQFYEILKAKEPVGRKLDFLVQEINREVNTIGSKCNDIEITKMVVEAKSEIEKIREQIQNIE